MSLYFDCLIVTRLASIPKPFVQSIYLLYIHWRHGFGAVFSLSNNIDILPEMLILM